jgi:hypothetical protein
MNMRSIRIQEYLKVQDNFSEEDHKEVVNSMNCIIKETNNLDNRKLIS